MFLKNYKLLLHLYILAAAAFVIHKGVFLLLKVNDENFHYSLELLYMIFLIFSTLILAVILKFRKDKFDSIGMIFMAGTFLKMFMLYAFLKPILSEKIYNVSIEKNNFFITFILFLLFETVLTARLLNEKR